MFWCLGLLSVKGQSPVHYGTLFVPEETQLLQSSQRRVQPLSCPPVHSCSCVQHTWPRYFSSQHYQTRCLDIPSEARNNEIHYVSVLVQCASQCESTTVFGRSAWVYTVPVQPRPPPRWPWKTTPLAGWLADIGWGWSVNLPILLW